MTVLDMAGNKPAVRAHPQSRAAFPWHSTIFWLLVAAAAMLGTFCLPFLFPLKIPVFSPVYTAGGNNRVGAMAAATVSLVTTLLCWRFGLLAKPSASIQSEVQRPAAGWMWAGMGVVTLSAAVLGIQMVRLNMYYADAGYFLNQLRSGMVLHGTLYRDVEFAYGPLLYLWPAAFIRVLGLAHVSVMAAYVVALCAMEALGTAMLYYTVNAMPLRRGMKIAAFLLLCLLTLDPQEGLNYTAFRFVCSAAALVLLSRQEKALRAALAAAVCAMATFGVSPEMGVAFTAGAGIYGMFRAWKTGATWLLVPAAALLGSGVFAVLVGSNYFRTLKDFANGGYNMLLEPAPHIYFLLLCTLWLAPVVVAAALADRRGGTVRAARNGLLLAIYVAGLALLPAALGRCDPLHVSFNGWPVFLLGFVALDRMLPRARRIGLTVALLFCVYCVTQEYALGLGSVKKLVRQQPDLQDDADFPRLQGVLAGHRVSFPWNQPMRLADELTAAGEYQPLYFCIAAVDSRAEMRTVADIRRADYVLSPNWLGVVTENKINNAGMKFRMRLGYRYKARNAPYLQGALLARELQANWRRVDTFGAYDLYQKER